MAKSPNGNELYPLSPASIFPVSRGYKPLASRSARAPRPHVRLLACVALLLAVPAGLAAQGDTTFTVWLRFRSAPGLTLRAPAVLRSPWDAGPRRPAALARAAWDSAVAADRDSLWSARVTAWRLRQVYGRRAQPGQDTTPARRGALGLDRRYADLNIEGNARLEVRSERLKNLRCTPSQYLDLNSGCRGSWKAPRLDTYLALRTGGLIGQRLHVDVDYDTERDFTARNNLQLYYQGLEDEIVRRVEVGTVVFRPPASRFLTAAIPANNFGVNATFDVGAFTFQGIAATQKGSVMAERTYSVGSTVVQPQDREARDLDFEGSRFFWVVDPAQLPGYPQLDILQLSPSGLPPAVTVQGDVRVYRYRPPSRSGVNPNLGGINAVAFGADTTQKVTAQWQLLQRDLDYYVDPTGLWFALASRLDPNDYLAVSYESGAGRVGTFPSADTPVPPGQPPRDTLRLIVQPRVDASRPTFRHEMRQVYRVAGADLDPASLRVTLSINRSERPLRPGAAATYLAELGLATPNDPTAFNLQDRLFPRTRDPSAAFTIKESYIVLPSAQPFADPAKLLPTERNDSLYRTPGYLLYSEGPPAKFVFRLQYNASSSGDRSTLDLGALSIRDGSETLYLNGRKLDKGTDYSINYDLGQVTFTDPQTLFGGSGATIQARFEERGVFAVAPTQIYGLSTRYSLGETGGINLLGLYQVEQSAFNRPQLGFEAQAHMVGGISTDLRFRPDAVTRFLNRLTSAPATAPSRLDLNGELAFTRPDPNRSGQAYLEEFEGDPGVQLSLRETLWEFGSRPQFADGAEVVLGKTAFDTTDAVQMTWQNLVQDRTSGEVVQLRARDIDPRIQVVGQQDQLETVLFMTLQPDTSAGRLTARSRWTLPTRPNAPRWRSMVTSLSSTGTDLSTNEFLEFWVFRAGDRSVDSAGLQLVVDLGSVSEDAVAMAPESLSVQAGDSVFAGRQFVGLGRLDTERQSTGVFNAAQDDIGILGDRPDQLAVDGVPTAGVPLCRQELDNVVTVYRWGDLGARCSNGNGALDAEDLDNDNQLDATGSGENVLRWVVDLRGSPYFVRTGAIAADSGQWELYRLPLRTEQYRLGSPNIRLVKHLRITAVAAPDQGGPDVRTFWALGRMRFLGSPWVRRSEKPVQSIAGATDAPGNGEVVSSTVSTENIELGYTSPPGVRGGLDKKGGGKGEFGSQVNERSLRVIAREILPGQRAEAYFRFPSGPQNLLRYKELRAWARGRGPGWDSRDFEVFIRAGSDSRNFYQFSANAATATWEPELRVRLDKWRELRAQIESRRLQGLPADSAARVACGGDTVSVAYVLCDGPYLAHIEDPAVNPPNLAEVQEIAAGIYRRSGNDPTDSAEVWVDDIRLTEPIARVGSALALDARLVASDVGDLSIGYVRQDGYFQQIGRDPSYRTTGTLQLATGLRVERFLPTSLGIVLPIQVNYARSSVAPELLTGTDILGKDLARLRTPESWSLSYSFAVRRTKRGRSWLVRGLVDPLSVSGNFSDARSTTELSEASNSTRNLQATYLLQSGRHGPTLDLSGLVRRLPGFLRRTDGAAALARPKVNFAPGSIRMGTGLLRNQGDLLAYDVPVRRGLDSLVRPAVSLTHTWRNTAGLTWQPLGMLTLSGDLTSTRDLRRYSDSTSLGRVAGRARRSLFGMDVGVERDRQLGTSLLLAPRVTSWLRPRYQTASSFVLSRSLTSRDPIREDGDTTGAFILPQTLNKTRQREYGAAVEYGRLLGRLVGDSSALARATRRLRPFDISDRLTRAGTFDLAAFDPDLGFQLALGGLDRFLRAQGDSALGASEVRTTTFQSGAELPFGMSFQLGYARSRTNRFQRTTEGYLTSETFQREWPKGTLRLTRAIHGFPVALVGVGATFRQVRGETTVPNTGGLPYVSRQRNRTVTPDAQLTLANGMVLSVTWAAVAQRNLANGNRTRVDQDDITAGFSHAFALPGALSRTRRVIRSQLTGILSKSLSCLQQSGQADCRTVSDTRRREFRATFDTDLGRIMTGGLQFSYSLNEARHLDRKFSQMSVAATFQLSLYAGDYR